LHDELLPKKRGENPRRTPTTLVDGIAHARQRMGDTALGSLWSIHLWLRQDAPGPGELAMKAPFYP